MAKKPYHGIEQETWLLIGDCHVHPDHSNERFTVLGNFINDRRPRRVIQNGDFEDMPSLSGYDKGKKTHEGVRYTQDILSVIEAQELLFGAIKKNIKFSTEFHLEGGNHGEGRINRALNNDPQRDNISVEDFLYEDFGWIYHKYNVPWNINDIWFSHHFNKGNLGKSISTENLGKTLLESNGRSSFMGHTHLRRLYSRTNIAGVKELAGDVGCFFDYQVDYMPPEPQANWARGLLLLNVLGNSIEGYEWIDMEALKRGYR